MSPATGSEAAQLSEVARQRNSDSRAGRRYGMAPARNGRGRGRHRRRSRRRCGRMRRGRRSWCWSSGMRCWRGRWCWRGCCCRWRRCWRGCRGRTGRSWRRLSRANRCRARGRRRGGGGGRRGCRRRTGALGRQILRRDERRRNSLFKFLDLKTLFSCGAQGHDSSPGLVRTADATAQESSCFGCRWVAQYVPSAMHTAVTARPTRARMLVGCACS